MKQPLLVSGGGPDRATGSRSALRGLVEDRRQGSRRSSSSAAKGGRVGTAENAHDPLEPRGLGGGHGRRLGQGPDGHKRGRPPLPAGAVCQSRGQVVSTRELRQSRQVLQGGRGLPGPTYGRRSRRARSVSRFDGPEPAPDVFGAAGGRLCEAGRGASCAGDAADGRIRGTCLRHSAGSACRGGDQSGGRDDAGRDGRLTADVANPRRQHQSPSPMAPAQGSRADSAGPLRRSRRQGGRSPHVERQVGFVRRHAGQGRRVVGKGTGRTAADERGRDPHDGGQG